MTLNIIVYITTKPSGQLLAERGLALYPYINLKVGVGRSGPPLETDPSLTTPTTTVNSVITQRIKVILANKIYDSNPRILKVLAMHLIHLQGALQPRNLTQCLPIGPYLTPPLTWPPQPILTVYSTN